MPFNANRCPICRQNYQSAEKLGAQDAHRISCQLCGRYDVSQQALLALEGPPEMLPYLSAHTRQAWELEGRIAQIDSTWPELAEIHKYTSVHQRAEKLLRVIQKRSNRPGEYVELKPQFDYPLVDGVDQREITYFSVYWQGLGCVEGRDILSSATSVRLTVKGWDRLDPASGGSGIPGRVFVAMSFDKSLYRDYEHGIKAAIEQDCRMACIRVDEIDHSEKICDRMLAEIRRSQVVVADFTKHSENVYFEAGFALALGRLVIWTCQEDHLKDAKFDTRQYPHLSWTDAKDLRAKLADRIQALLAPNAGIRTAGA